MADAIENTTRGSRRKYRCHKRKTSGGSVTEAQVRKGMLSGVEQSGAAGSAIVSWCQSGSRKRRPGVNPGSTSLESMYREPTRGRLTDFTSPFSGHGRRIFAENCRFSPSKIRTVTSPLLRKNPAKPHSVLEIKEGRVTLPASAECPVFDATLWAKFRSVFGTSAGQSRLKRLRQCYPILGDLPTLAGIHCRP